MPHWKGEINFTKKIIQVDRSIMTTLGRKYFRHLDQQQKSRKRKKISIDLIDVKKIIPDILPVDSADKHPSTIRKLSWLALLLSGLSYFFVGLMASVSPCHNCFLFNPTRHHHATTKWITQFISITRYANKDVLSRDE